MDTSRPIYPELADKGKSDPYHKDLTDDDRKDLALLWFAQQYSGEFIAEDLLSMLEGMSPDSLDRAEDT